MNANKDQQQVELAIYHAQKEALDKLLDSPSRMNIFKLLSEEQSREKVICALAAYGLPRTAMDIIQRDNIAIVGHVANYLGMCTTFRQPYDIFKPLKLYTTFLGDDFQALLKEAGYEHQELRGATDCQKCADLLVIPYGRGENYIKTFAKSAYGHAHPPDPNNKCSDPMRWLSSFDVQPADRSCDIYCNDGLSDKPYESNVRMYKSFDKTNNSYRYIEIVMLNTPRALRSTIIERAPTQDLMSWLHQGELFCMQDFELPINDVTFNKAAVTTHCIGLQRMLEMRHIWHTCCEKTGSDPYDFYAKNVICRPKDLFDCNPGDRRRLPELPYKQHY